MAYYALIGGRSIPHLKDFTLEEKIFSHLHKTPKQILFIPLATYPNMEDAILKFQALVPNQYSILSLTSFEDFDALREKFLKAEVIYFSGGCAEELVRLVKKFKIDILIKEFMNTDKLFMEISAGAILLTQAGMGDRYSYKDRGNIYNYQMVEGLGILPITLCPHYDHDGLECYNIEVKNYPYDGYALEDDTAILIENNNDIVFKQDSRKSVYHFNSKDGYLMKSLYEVKK